MSTELPANPYANRSDYVEVEGAPYAISLAILALAYEQRTANLIASLQPITVAGGTEIGPNPDHAINVLALVNERMGLDIGGTE